MKILILANSASGFYSFRKELLQELVNYKYKVFLSVPNDERTDDLRNLGAKIIDTPIDRRGTNPVSDLKLLLKYLKLIKTIQPSVVLTYTIKPNIYGGLACRLRKVKYLTNITGLGSALENKGKLQRISIALYKMAMKNVNTLFFQNKANMKFFEDHKMVQKANKVLIPGSGVNLNYYQPLEYPKDDVVKFVFISRLLKEKGIEDYLNAAQIVKEKYPDTEFHICGGMDESYGVYIDDLQKKGVVIYHGKVRDVRVIHQSIHCLVHPSYYPEGMSNVLLEACSSARPIITTNRPGCGEIIEDGLNGYLVQEKNVDDLVAKMSDFIQLSYVQKKSLGNNARRKVEKIFDRKIVIEAYIEQLF